MFAMDFKRYKILNLFFIFICFLLVIRLFYIQVVNGDYYGEKAMNQRSLSFRFYPIRGDIYDRNFIPLTGRNFHTYIVVIPSLINSPQEVISFIKKYTNYSEEEIFNMITNPKNNVLVLKSSKDDIVEDMSIKGIEIMKYEDRYEDTLAHHVIGYINKRDGYGESGLEKTFNEVLSGNNRDELAVFFDANKNFIRGLGIRVLNKNQTYSIKTTLDYHIQKTVEDVLDKYKRNGAVVVLDAKNSEILAMASRPNFDQDNIEKYLKSTESELLNKALLNYAPGSVFKIIVAAAALEKGIVDLDEQFFCDGFYIVNGVKFRCYKEEKHGYISFEEAFSKSCNSTFIQVAQRVGYKNIIDMAKKFGVGEVFDIDLPMEKGSLPDERDAMGAGIGNLAIGQGKVAITPLHAAEIIATIVNGGIRKNPVLVKSIVSSDKEQVLHNSDEGIRVISEKTALKLKEMMGKVVLEGTGSKIKLGEYGGAGGKSGTAEVTKNINNTWFAGFVPYEKPRFIIVVFLEKGTTGGDDAAQLFYEIAKSILQR